MSETISISVILAGYNEENLVAETIDRHIKMLENNFENYEIILVDDASKDNTVSIMENYSKQNPHIILIRNLVNLNFGTSILRGLIFASKEYVIFNAIDMPLLPEDIPQIIKEIDDNNADLMVLERLEYKCAGWRKITSKTNQYLLKLLFPKLSRGIFTFNFIQVFKASIITEIIPIARSPIFVWPEMIFRAKINKLHIICKSVTVNPKIQLRSGAFGKPHDIIWGLYDMLRFRIYLWGKKI